MKFRKKPVVIDALRWVGQKAEIERFFGDFKRFHYAQEGILNSLFIETLEGLHEARIGDWIIKGVKGEFYPCKPDVFEQTYEQAEAQLSDNSQ